MGILYEIEGPARSTHPQDHWIEAYLEALERWRISLKAGEPVRDKLCEAWSCYAQYRRTGHPFSHWSAWRAIHAAAAALAKLPKQGTIT